MAKYLSKDAAIEAVKRFFANTTSDSLSIQDAYTAWNRDLSKSKTNKDWLSNKLVDLKYHNLISSIYGMRNNRRTLTKIQLTLEGKRAIGRVQDANKHVEDNQILANGNISLETIMKEIPRLKRENPEFNIVFSVTPKD